MAFDGIWKIRNNICFNGASFSLDKAIGLIRNYIHFWKDNIHEDNNQKHGPVLHTPQVQLGHDDLMAIVTFDAAVTHTGSVIIVVLRDGRSNFLGAYVAGVSTTDPFVAEFTACLEAVKIDTGKDFTKIVILGDCSVILDALNDVGTPPPHQAFDRPNSRVM
ncbi:hypothetical protein Ancab_030235 [Ancistrocladus abbreviatus]